MSTQTHPFASGVRKPPTKKHRPAIWESMLGTVNAMNDAQQVKYFDYDWDAARAFAGVSPDRDPRVAKFTREHARYRWHNGSINATQPRAGQWTLWVTK